MDGAPSVSAIVPAYNAANYLGRAIDSILRQTYPVLEILVVDDGSCDATSEIASSYAPAVRLLRQENAGPGAARNAAARVARGRWLAFLDADDHWLPEKIERQLTFASERAADLVYSLGTSELMEAGRDSATHPEASATFANLWRRNFISQSSVLVLKSVFDEAGGYDEDRELIGVEDYHLWLRLASANRRMLLCPEVVFHYSPEPGNLTSQWDRILRADLRIVDKLEKTLNLEARIARDRRSRLLHEYGRSYLNVRALGVARRLFVRSFLSHPSLGELPWLAATLAPPAVLDLRRRMRGKLNARTG